MKKNKDYPVLTIAVFVFKILSLLFPGLFLVSSAWLLYRGAPLSSLAGAVAAFLSWFLFRLYAEGLEVFMEIWGAFSGKGSGFWQAVLFSCIKGP